MEGSRPICTTPPGGHAIPVVCSPRLLAGAHQAGDPSSAKSFKDLRSMASVQESNVVDREGFPCSPGSKSLESLTGAGIDIAAVEPVQCDGPNTPHQVDGTQSTEDEPQPSSRQSTVDGTQPQLPGSANAPNRRKQPIRSSTSAVSSLPSAAHSMSSHEDAMGHYPSVRSSFKGTEVDEVTVDKAYEHLLQLVKFEEDEDPTQSSRLSAEVMDDEIVSHASIRSMKSTTTVFIEGCWASWKHKIVSWCRPLTRNRWFVAFFMLLTFYALFAPDLDSMVGTKESEHNLSIASTAVFFLFFFEWMVQSFGTKDYFLKAYFWLDLLAGLSLLPDTYMVQEASGDNSYAAGRSSRLTKIVRVVARSSKATRLNRLARIVRVAALLPRLAKFVKRKVKEEDLQRLLEKHLRRTFMCMDRGATGMCQRVQAFHLQTKVRAELDSQGQRNLVWAAKMASSLNLNAPQDLFGTKKDQLIPKTAEDIDWLEDEEIDFAQFTEILLHDDVLKERLRKVCAEELQQGNNMENMTAKNSEFIGVKVAMGVLVLLFVLSAFETEVIDGSALQGLEQIENILRASSATPSLVGASISIMMKKQVNAWIKPYTGYESDLTVTRKLLYLDIDHNVYCNQLIEDGPSCDVSVESVAVWSSRTSLDHIDDQARASGLRGGDFMTIILPTLEDTGEDSGEEWNAKITTVAFFDNSDAVRSSALQSFILTCLVIFTILGGITMLSRDLSFLSCNLLKPLKDLAIEMENIVELQLGGMASNTVASVGDAKEAEQDSEIVSEVRMIRRTFENMKVAIKSWGKYVPWPVVQLLLATDVKGDLEVGDSEVTVFFSDIASFTTIVEKLAPERSLLLLSRYFNDMSKVIDANDGIVIEFIGDAILAVYGAPKMNERHPAAAVKSALQMMAALTKMNNWSIHHDLPVVSVRCGLHTGTSLVGNMGWASRMKYGIVGSESEVAPKLEEMNKNYGTVILISSALKARLDDDEDRFYTRPIDNVCIRPHISPEPELVYEVRQPERKSAKIETLQKAMDAHGRGYDSYLNMQFEEAATTFAHVNSLLTGLTGQDDEASAMMLTRCAYYVDNPPAKPWDGVWEGT